MWFIIYEKLKYMTVIAQARKGEMELYYCKVLTLYGNDILSLEVP